ncbi:MAG: aminopeptidase C [Candidatus Zhuqueibacterota bacterium]
MKRYFMVLAVCLFLIPLFSANALAQQAESAISETMLRTIESSFKLDGPTRAIMNAVSNNNIQELAVNRELVGKTDHFFAHRIKTDAITDQKSSGRCWLFTSLNVLRPQIIKKNNLKEFQFSENYLFFWDQLEKANLFLEGIISTRDQKMDDRDVEWLFKNPLQDGGIWNYAVDLIGKYGAVPKDAMAESYNSENTGMMRRLVSSKLKSQGLTLRELHKKGRTVSELRSEKVSMLAEIYRMLVINLGLPPKEFTWIYEDKDGKISAPKTYTPQAFYQEIVAINLRDYVQLMNDPTRPYFKLYEIKFDRNMADRQNWTFINLPTDAIKKFAKASILADEAMYFSCDVGKQLDRDAGILRPGLYDYESIYGVKFEMDKVERIQTYDSGSSHGMSLVGVDTTADGSTTKWLLENSWGKSSGYNGFLIMTDDWFDDYMFRLVVHKTFVSPDVLEILKQKPILLAPWDRMF